MEIGCDRNQSFSNIKIEKRVGVDPVEGGTHKMTSDEFFNENKFSFQKKLLHLFIVGITPKFLKDLLKKK